MAVLSNESSVEEQLRKQLEQAQARIKEIEEKQVYPAALKKDANGKPISSQVIVQLFESKMNPNQIGKKLGMTHQRSDQDSRS